MIRMKEDPIQNSLIEPSLTWESIYAEYIQFLNKCHRIATGKDSSNTSNIDVGSLPHYEVKKIVVKIHTFVNHICDFEVPSPEEYVNLRLQKTHDYLIDNLHFLRDD